MMKIKLPRGIKYRVEPTQPGIVIPGSENEPIITVFGRGSKIQCKLVSCAMEQEYIVQDTYLTGSLNDDEVEMVHSWVEYLLNATMIFLRRLYMELTGIKRKKENEMETSRIPL